MEKRKILAVAAIVFTCVIWGLSFISIKISVEAVPPVTLALYRFLIASAVLSVVVWIQSKGKWPVMEKRDIPRFVFGGITGISLYFLFENTGVKLTGASIASIIIASIPVFSMLADVIIEKNRFSLWNAAGVVLSVVGVGMVINYRGKLAWDLPTVMGYVCMFVTAVTWVVYNFITRPLTGGKRKYSNLTVTFYQTLFGTAALLVMSLAELPTGKTWQPVSWTVTWNILFLALFCSAAGYFLYLFTMSVLGVQTTTIFINLIPVVTVIAGYFLLGEGIEFLQVVGGILVVLAVTLTTLAPTNGQKGEKRPKRRGVS